MIKSKLSLFGGRVACIKFALKRTIESFNNNGQSDMAEIYKAMLDEVIRNEYEEYKF